MIPLLSTKNEGARKMCAQAIAALAPEAARQAGIVPPPDFGLSRKQLIAGFADFSHERQAELLDDKWDLIRGEEIIPALCALIEKVPTNASDDLSSAALLRLTEVSPQEAAKIIVTDLARAKPRFAYFAEHNFPAQDVPSADAALLERLKTDLVAALPLAAKFATARIAPQFEVLSERFQSCRESQWIVVYFLRTLPERGRQALEKVIADNTRGCRHFVFTQTAFLVWNSSIQSVAVAALDDLDPETVADAAKALAARGSAAVEPFLWRRLTKWSDEWRGRNAEFEGHPIAGGGNRDEERLGEALFDAIGSASAWFLDTSRRKRLLQLCLTDSCRERWGSDHLITAEMPIEASSGGLAYPTAFRVLTYTEASLDRFKAKLSQFPSGSQFRWCPPVWNRNDAFTPSHRDEIFRDLVAFAEQNSLTLAPYAADKCGHTGKQ
jgi:hypothetical protein